LALITLRFSSNRRIGKQVSRSIFRQARDRVGHEYSYLYDPIFPHCAEILRQHLPNDTIRACLAEQVHTEAARVAVLIPAMFRVDAEVIATTSATIIHQFGVGLEGVDIVAATRRGIYVANVPRT
jgi:lactate dehydrogenase-like 2-hydroxyacid dehydrogenase